MSTLGKKIFVSAVAALTIAAFAVPPQAQAQTVAELQAQIAALLAQIQALQAQLNVVQGGSAGTGVAGIPAGFQWNENLTVGSTGNDVMYLQMALNAWNDSPLAASGAGSPGNETTYFGPITRAGVIAFQNKYASEVLAPVGLSSGTGYFGPSSRSKANMLLAAVPTPIPTPPPGTPPPPPGTPPPPPGTPPPPPSTPGTVSISFVGPTSSTLVAGQATANLAEYMFSGSGTVTNVTLQRTGVSANTTPSNVYLFDGSQRLTDPASVNSDGEVTFNDPNGLFVVNGSRTISVRSDIAASTNGETVGVNLKSATLSSGTVNGVPITGNVHTIASATLAGVAFGAITPSTSSLTPANDQVIWQSTATISTRNVNLTRVAYRQIGSINSADLQNFRLQINGVQVAQVQSLDANGYVTFDLSAEPYLLQTGSRIFRVLADVIGGSGRNIEMSLRRAADIGVVDSNYNVNITATATNGFAAGTGVISVSAGSMTVIKASDSPSGNITNSATDAVLARYIFTAFGEPIKVETLTVDFTYTDAGGTTNAGATLRNGRIMVNGSQVGSTATLNPAGNGTQYTTNFLVNPGTPATVEVRADIFDNDGTGALEASDTILINLYGASTLNNAIPQTSLGTLDVPSANVSANTLTVQTGSLTLVSTSSYGNQTVVVPQTAYKLGSWELSNGDIEAVNVTTLSIDIDETSGTTFNEADITDFYLKYGNSTTTVKSTAAAADNDWSVNFSLAKNAAMTIELWGNIGSTITATDAMKTDLTVTGTGEGSATSVSAADVDGQTITANTGSITASAAQTPNAAILDDSGTVTTAKFLFSTVNDAYTITDMTVTLGNASAVSMVHLKNEDGTTTYASRPASTSVAFSGLTIPVPANTVDHPVRVDLDLAAVGAGGGTTGSSVQTALNTATAKNSQGVSATTSGVPGPTGKAMYVYKAIPKITNVALPTTTLVANGEVIMSKIKVESIGGTIGWKKIIFEVTKTANVGIIVTAGDLKLYDVTSGSRVEVAGTHTVATLATGDTAGTVSFVATNEQQISGSKTYELVETNGSAITANGSIGTRINNATTSFTASNTYANKSGGTETFVWTDRSTNSHSETTTDWTDDYLVKDLPSSTQTLSITTF